MHPQLQLVADEYRSAQARLHDLVRAVPDEQWSKRSDPARWSVAECVAHLNITSLAYVPLLQHAVSRARMLERRSPSRYRRDPIGWLLWATMGPPVRFRIKTIARFLPSSVAAPELVVQEFDRLQAAQLDCLAQADGLPLSQVRVTSPFNARNSICLPLGAEWLQRPSTSLSYFADGEYRHGIRLRSRQPTLLRVDWYRARGCTGTRRQSRSPNVG